MRRFRLTGFAIFLLAACTSDVLAQTTSKATAYYSLLYEVDKADDFEAAAEYVDRLRELAPWAASDPSVPFDRSGAIENFLERAIRAYEGVGREEAAVEVVTEVLSYIGEASRDRWEGWLEERQ